MTEAIRVYIGWDPRDELAWRVAAASLRKHASVPVEIIALKDFELRARGIYWRDVYIDPAGRRWDCKTDREFSTDFTYTRHLIPKIEDYADTKVVFIDADVMWRGDVAELLAAADPGKAISCVKHTHEPPEIMKGVGIQSAYRRKNWSSVMVMNPSRCRALTPFIVNRERGNWLQAMLWCRDEEIGALGVEWNWLCGWSSEAVDPKIVHYTRGYPSIFGYENEPFADEWRSYADKLAA